MQIPTTHQVSELGQSARLHSSIATLEVPVGSERLLSFCFSLGRTGLVGRELIGRLKASTMLVSLRTRNSQVVLEFYPPLCLTLVDSELFDLSDSGLVKEFNSGLVVSRFYSALTIEGKSKTCFS